MIVTVLHRHERGSLSVPHYDLSSRAAVASCCLDLCDCSVGDDDPIWIDRAQRIAVVRRLIDRGHQVRVVRYDAPDRPIDATPPAHPNSRCTNPSPPAPQPPEEAPPDQ